MRKLQYALALAGFYAGELLAFAGGVSVLFLLASIAVFLLAAGAVVIAVGFLREELAGFGERLRGAGRP